MKTRLAVTLALSGVILLGFGPQAFTQSITVKVPFSFVISDRTFPAGEYSISSSRAKVIVQDAEGKTISMMYSNAVSGRRVGPSGEVVFHCYANRCFLSELWTPTSDVGCQLLRSRYEIESSKSNSQTYFALVGVPPEKK